MTSTIFTIGFTKKSAEEFFRLLQEAHVRKLIDIRENRGASLARNECVPAIRELTLSDLAGWNLDCWPNTREDQLVATNCHMRAIMRMLGVETQT